MRGNERVRLPKLVGVDPELLRGGQPERTLGRIPALPRGLGGEHSRLQQVDDVLGSGAATNHLVQIHAPTRDPHGARRHPAFREGAGLVGADHRGGAERLHGREALDEAALASHAEHAERQGERQGRQQPLRDIGHDHPEGEHEAIAQGHAAGGDPEGKEDGAKGHREQGHRPGHPRQLDLQGARFLADRLGQLRDAADLGPHPGRAHDGRSRLPAITPVPAKTSSWRS